MDRRGEEIVGVKSISFSVETFSFYQKKQKNRFAPFSSNLLRPPWGYDGSNLSEKEFQLF